MPTETERRGNAKSFIAGILFLLAAFGAGFYLGERRVSENPTSLLGGGSAVPPVGVDFSPLWKSWAELNAKFVPAGTSSVATQQEMLWGAIGGLANSLGDPYTVFFPPEESKSFAEEISGTFGGVGMEIGIRDGVLTVIAPLKGSPAERQGIRTGDVILKIDGESTEQLSVDVAVKQIRGEIGTEVTLLLAHEGEEPRTVTITREEIQIPTIDYEKRDDGVFVIQLYNFSAISANLFRDALREFVRSDTQNLIIDLRGNPGGYLEAAVDMASWFLPAGRVVVTEDYGKNGSPNVHRSRGYNVFNDNIRIVILVNGGSASASEIFAGAMQEYGKAQLVGTQTFGKGSVQELVHVTDDTSLKVTVARWLTPKGRSISDGGLTPDVEVEVSREDIEAGKDPQMDKAVALLLAEPQLLIRNSENPL